jgi:hypothetical protein
LVRSTRAKGYSQRSDLDAKKLDAPLISIIAARIDLWELSVSGQQGCHFEAHSHLISLSREFLDRRPASGECTAHRGEAVALSLACIALSQAGKNLAGKNLHRHSLCVVF